MRGVSRRKFVKRKGYFKGGGVFFASLVIRNMKGGRVHHKTSKDCPKLVFSYENLFNLKVWLDI